MKVDILCFIFSLVGAQLGLDWLKSFLNGLTLHLRLAVVVKVDVGLGLAGRNLEYIEMVQESESRNSTALFPSVRKWAKSVKEIAEREGLLLPPKFQVCLEINALIRKSDGITFGLTWYQRIFDALVAKLERLLSTIYCGFVFAPVLMCWEVDRVAGKGRRVLSSDADAIGYLEQKWNVWRRPDQEKFNEFSELVGE